MIWLWITAAIVITLLLLRKQHIAFRHLIWVLLPIDFYGVNIGVTIKPYMLFALVLLFLNLISKGKMKLRLSPEWLAGLLTLILLLLLVDLLNESNTASLLQQTMFLLVFLCALVYVSSLKAYAEVEQIRSVIFATSIGFGIVYLFAVFANLQEFDPAGLIASVREDPGVIMKLADMPDGRLRGFFIDPNAFGTSLITALTLSVHQMLGLKKEKKKLYILQIAITLLCCYFAKSRGILLTVLLISLFTTISCIRPSRQKLGLGFVSVILLLCMLTLSATIFAAEEVSLAMELILQQYEGRADFSDTYGRSAAWQSAWDALIENNLFFGVGQGRVSEVSVLQLESHNTWLEWVVTNGIFAGSLVDFYFGLVLLQFWRYCGKFRDMSDYADFLLGIKWAYMGIAIMLLSISNITNSYLIFTATLMMALMSDWKREGPEYYEYPLKNYDTTVVSVGHRF